MASELHINSGIYVSCRTSILGFTASTIDKTKADLLVNTSIASEVHVNSGIYVSCRTLVLGTCIICVYICMFVTCSHVGTFETFRMSKLHQPFYVTFSLKRKKMLSLLTKFNTMFLHI